MELKIQDRFSSSLAADPNKSNSRRQVEQACFSFVRPRIPSAPKLIHAFTETAHLLGIDEQGIDSTHFLNVFSGTEILDNSAPYAMCYGGHQFGHWAGQLGDGRAINLAEILHDHKHWTLQLKGAGETPYSRNADGLAVLRSSIREHLCSEAMFHLRVPNKRSLSLILSGDEVMRDMMYDGNPKLEKGAIVCRVSPSFIRFGNFEIFASRKDIKNLKALADFTIKHYFPGVQESTNLKYVSFFKEVAQRTMSMIVEWQRVGFVHGVMNTDNMSILGLSIDYGPYGWLEGYDPNWTPNTTDRQHRRYRYGHQANVSLWNLFQLANALYPLVEESKPFEEVLNPYQKEYELAYAKMMHSKIGLRQINKTNLVLIDDLVSNLQVQETDMTIFFRNLSSFLSSNKIDLEFVGKFLEPSFYSKEVLQTKVLEKWVNWFIKYKEALQGEDSIDEQRKSAMNKVNPKYVFRNYMAQLAIDDADKGNYDLIHEFADLLREPYEEQKDKEKWFAKRPEWARNKVGCSMLSCSS